MHVYAVLARLKFLNWKTQMNGNFNHIDQLDNKDNDTDVAFKISLVSLFFLLKLNHILGYGH